MSLPILPMQDAAAGAVFSPDRVHRFRLWRIWGPAEPACFCMLNPSTADETDLDPTLRRCVSFARAWGCGGLVVVNLFAVVSADPRVLLTHPDPVGLGNDGEILSASSQSSMVLVGWGAFPEAHDRASHVTTMLLDNGIPLRCLGHTKDGHPRHPLYVSGATKPVPFEWDRHGGKLA